MTTMLKTRALAAAALASGLLLTACGATEEGEAAQAEGSDVDIDESLRDCEPGGESIDLTSEEPGQDEDTAVTVGVFNGWHDNFISAHLTKYFLEEFGDYGYDVEVRAFEPAPGFTGTAAGDVDWLASSQLPTTHADYLSEFGDDLEIQTCWHTPATNSIAVTEDSPAQTIEDLAEMGDEYGERIVGIEPGAGLMRMTANSVMPTYGLDDWELMEASTPAMLAEVESAAESGENLAVTMWRPHWAYEAFPLRDLEDPEGAFGEPELLFQLSRTGFTEDHPFISQVLKNMVVDEERMASLQYLMASPDEYDGENPEQAIQEWAEDNQDFFEEWRAGELSAGGSSE